tara:strand:- start:23509 stop:23784 length:276 start_codon:yes stop_codon:yes gene_type:complete
MSSLVSEVYEEEAYTIVLNPSGPSKNIKIRDVLPEEKSNTELVNYVTYLPTSIDDKSFPLALSKWKRENPGVAIVSIFPDNIGRVKITYTK